MIVWFKEFAWINFLLYSVLLHILFAMLHKKDLNVIIVIVHTFFFSNLHQNTHMRHFLRFACNTKIFANACFVFAFANAKDLRFFFFFSSLLSSAQAARMFLLMSYYSLRTIVVTRIVSLNTVTNVSVNVLLIVIPDASG